MNIYLGNLSVAEIEKRLEITLTDEERKQLSEDRQERCENLGADKWHCYDMPFLIACGSSEQAKKVYNLLKPYADKMKKQIQIGVI